MTRCSASSGTKRTREGCGDVSEGKRRRRSSSRDKTRHNLERQEQTGKERVKKYYTPKQSDEEGHYHVVCGADISPRYKILDLMGEGTFAKVVEIWDRKELARYAVKIVRATKKYIRDAECELSILERLRRKDGEDKYKIVKLVSSFRFQSTEGEHLAIVFPKLGPSLLDFINKNGAFTLSGIAQMTRQILEALNWLHNVVGMIHTDLKPENILLAQSGYTHEGKRRVPTSYEIRIIDFGGATDEEHSDDSIVSTRHYRAPEVILGSGWMYPADIWSVGCILIELYTGDVLFDTHENREHLALMEQIIRPFPPGFASNISESARKYFRPNGSLRWPEMASSEKSIAKVGKSVPLAKLCDNADFIDLIHKMLDYSKHDRLTAEAALGHPFLKL
eukprot:TRINITY_DN1054_c0_g1_i1.p1 TRINITY_DN1054_c0_g1~~TRINITY_DN1054_c0_g1_i1.p1  ORF type:complete len:392 (-),score=44.46 TRINITY_DN1054_c0_g1_i1:11-1186(-)